MSPNEKAGPARGGEATRASERLAADLESLARVTAERPDDIETTTRLLRERSRRDIEGGVPVKLWNSLNSGRGWAVAAAAAVALALLFVPIRYTRTTGCDVDLKLAGASQAGTPFADIARQMKGLLGAETVTLSMSTRGDGAGGAVLSAHVKGGSAASVRTAAEGFARALTAKGVTATAEVRPVREPALGSVCAMAADRIREIRVQGKGKTTAEIEQEITRRLAEVGFTNPSVQVTREGERTRIEVKIETKGAPKSAGGARVTVDDKQGK
ncbi:MAG: hypothetical protein HZB25_02270 [Candidatus Eisenbacteria bacterium]|nr:hypothetical protein [Candidatus Eisenbacteria bacterium]